MAYVFKRGKMMSGVADVALANAVASTDVYDGSLLVLGELAADDTYDANGKEYDTYEATAPAAATDEVVIVDYAGISEGPINENNYKMGIKLYNLACPAGTPMRVRRLYLHDKFWLGEHNFVGNAPVVGEYATATAGDCRHTPVAELPEEGYAIKVLLAEDLTAGMASKGKLYLCEVVSL